MRALSTIAPWFAVPVRRTRRGWPHPAAARRIAADAATGQGPPPAGLPWRGGAAAPAASARTPRAQPCEPPPHARSLRCRRPDGASGPTPEGGIMLDLNTLRGEIEAFNARGQTGPDPVARLYRERRRQWSLFTPRLSDEEIEALRPYIFCYDKLPETPDDKPVPLRNFIGGEWRPAARTAVMKAHFDRRVPLCELTASDEHDVAAALAVAEDYWASLEWADEVVSYRKWVVKNFSRILEYFVEECLTEIRHQIPKTRLEAEKDFWEAKRAADHLEGSAEKAMQGELLPPLIGGHTYWKNDFLPAGICAVITPMNFIYGIPGIQIVGAYLSGSPFIFK